MTDAAPKLSNRGFKHFDPITTDRYESISVYESSAAFEPHIWVSVKVTPSLDGYPIVAPGDGHAHLTLEQAGLLRDQLDYLIKHHYQVEDS